MTDAPSTVPDPAADPWPGLDPVESRVLGVLVEKAQTVPSQYPMTLNGLRSGANQRNNREPVLELDEDDVLSALDRLRTKGLAREVMMSGSRVAKFKHDARARLGVGTSELVVLTELLLRGPQTVGELRGRASRMHPLESTDVVTAVLTSLAERTPPMVAPAGRTSGGRAARWAQRLCPDLHPLDAADARGGSDEVDDPRGGEPGSERPRPAAAVAAPTAEVPATLERLAALEARIAALEAALGVEPG